MTEKKLTGEIKGKAAAVKERVSAAKKEISKRVTQKAKPAAPNTVTTNRLKLLVTVVARKKAEFYADLIQSFDVNMQMIALAEVIVSSINNTLSVRKRKCRTPSNLNGNITF